MIEVDGVSKFVGTGSIRRLVLKDVTATFPGTGVTGILGPRGCGKSTLIRLLAGVEAPHIGSIRRRGQVSFPLGFGGGMDPRMTVAENLGFIARVNGLDPHDFVRAVALMSGLESDLRRPFVSVPGDRKNRILYSMSYCIPFDTYLVDGSPVIGGGRFRAACNSFFEERRQTSAFIVATSAPAILRRHCDRACVLHNGEIIFWGGVEDAIALFATLPEGMAAIEAETEEEDEEEGLFL